LKQARNPHNICQVPTTVFLWLSRGKVYSAIIKQLEMQGSISNMRGDIAEMQGSISNMRGDIDALTTQVAEVNFRTERIEQRLEMTFEAVGNMSEDVTDSRHHQERYELVLGEIATTLLEHNARIRLSTAG
jgi:TolA-binding protein